MSRPCWEPNGNPLTHFLRSLDRLRPAVPPETPVLPSHNPPFFGLHARIDALAERHRALRGSHRRLCPGPDCDGAAADLLFARLLDRHQTAFALGEALAHLHYYLEPQSELSRVTGDDGVAQFICTSGRK
jgi:glyoxylase-like metal-dependent hydrolase (beta-lactamase superfamily II)